MRLFGEPSKYSWKMKQFLAKESKTRAPVHESLVCFNLVHRLLNWPLAPKKGQSCSDCIVIPFNANDKTVQFFDPTLTSLLHPPIEFLWSSFTEHLKKRLEQLVHSTFVCAASAELALPGVDTDELYCGQDEVRRQSYGDCLPARAYFSPDLPGAAFALFSLWRHSGRSLGPAAVAVYMQWQPLEQWFSMLEMAVFECFGEEYSSEQHLLDLYTNAIYPQLVMQMEHLELLHLHRLLHGLGSRFRFQGEPQATA